MDLVVSQDIAGKEGVVELAQFVFMMFASHIFNKIENGTPICASVAIWFPNYNTLACSAMCSVLAIVKNPSLVIILSIYGIANFRKRRDSF